MRIVAGMAVQRQWMACSAVSVSMQPTKRNGQELVREQESARDGLLFRCSDFAGSVSFRSGPFVTAVLGLGWLVTVLVGSFLPLS